MTEIVGLRNHEVSDDGSLLSLTFEGRVGELISVSLPTDYLDGFLTSFGRAKEEVAARRQPQKTLLSFRGLQSWSISNMPGQEYVFLILDGSTAREAPYALRPEMAVELASAMLNSARAAREQRKDN